MGIKKILLTIFTIYLIGSVLNVLYNLYLYYFSNKEYFNKVRDMVESDSKVSYIGFIVSLVAISIIYSWRGIYQNINSLPDD